MVLSKNKQGYGGTIWQLWDTCNTKGIKLPQFNTIAASSLCEARQKLPEIIFATFFKNCLATVGNYLEDLILTGTTSIEKWLYRQMRSVVKLKQRLRPNGSYPRVSFKPRNSWNSFGKGARA